jgi:fructokinase
VGDGVQKVVLSFGEILWDHFPSGPVLGGAPLNLACRIQGLGDRGIIVSRLGRDEPGHRARDQISAFGLDVSYVQMDDRYPTGSVQVTLDGEGNPGFSIAPGAAYDFIDVTGPLLDLAASADCFCFGTLSQRAQTSRRSLQRLLEVTGKGLKFLDINLRKDCFFRETITESLTRANILKLNLQEAHYLAELFEISLSSLPDFCSEMIEEWSLSCCLVTLGEHGAFAASADSAKVYVPGYEIAVVDTCGAGDAFSAGFIHQHLRGESLAECCRFGNALGAMVAMQRGATAPLCGGQVREFLDSKLRRFHEPRLRPFEVG